jgi:hypothetical protein
LIARLLLLVCAVVVADALAADPNASEAAGQGPSRAPPGAPLSSVAQTTISPSTLGTDATTAGPSSSGKPTTGTQTDSTETSPAPVNGPPVANKPRKKVLVDDTVTDAQLKQILARGYKPESQARGNEVYYCRSEHELGTRFEKKVCKTATRILQDELQGKDEATRVERPSGNKALNGGL